MSKDNIFASFIKVAENEYASIVEDGIAAGDVTGFIDTGSYCLNALLSGSIYGGLPANKVTAFAGEPATGKTFYAINVCKRFLEENPKGFIFYFESESAITTDMFKERGLDPKRIAIMPVATIQEFRTQAIKILNRYLDLKEADRDPMFFVLDSLGNLSTEKEMADISEGKDTRDMTRAQLIRGAFRVLTLKLGKAKVPLLLTNHTYEVVGCALKGTMVQTIHGPKDISEIVVGDQVQTLVGPKSVINTFVYDVKDYYEIEFDNGSIFNLTGEHKLMVQTGEWKKVSQLTEKDIVINIGQ